MSKKGYSFFLRRPFHELLSVFRPQSPKQHKKPSREIAIDDSHRKKRLKKKIEGIRYQAKCRGRHRRKKIARWRKADKQARISRRRNRRKK